MNLHCLSKTIVESEDAHYTAFQPPRLTVIPGGLSAPTHEKIKEEIQNALQEFLHLYNGLNQNNAIFEESLAFTYFKAVYEEFAEYVLNSRRELRKLSRNQLNEIIRVFQDNPTKAFFFKGAKLLMFIESNDALRDSELYYLQKYDPKAQEKNTGPSYHRIVRKRILSEMQLCLEKTAHRKKGENILKPLACACILLLALV